MRLQVLGLMVLKYNNYTLLFSSLEIFFKRFELKSIFVSHYLLYFVWMLTFLVNGGFQSVNEMKAVIPGFVEPWRIYPLMGDT